MSLSSVLGGVICEFKEEIQMKITEIYQCNGNTKIKLPLFLSKIRAGFPSSADDYLDKKLDLNEYLRVKLQVEE